MKILLCSMVATMIAATSANAASRLTNVSVRSAAGTGADTLIVGFTVKGAGSKSVLVRGVGPTLGVFGVTNAVTDPELRLIDQANATVATNDNWSTSAGIAAAATAVGAFALPATSADAALLAQLSAGSYSVHLGAKSGTGAALVEAYDMDAVTSAAEISNVSARSVSGAGADVLTVGFAITGDTPATVLIRAVGPTLGTFGVTGVIANPRLNVFRGSTVLVQNDDWPGLTGWDAAFASVGAFALPTGSRDAALLVRLPPGAYTAQAAGAPAAGAVALIEVYAVSNPPTTSLVFEPVLGLELEQSGPRTATVVLTQARPIYPFEQRRAGISGEVVIDFFVDATGRVVNAYPLRSTDNGFNESAVTAVRQWTFRPALNAAGQPVATHLQVPIVYTLN